MSTSATLPALPKTDPSTGLILPGRLSSIDAYRGFVMLLIMAQVLHPDDVLNSRFWHAFWVYGQDHVQWVGFILHDVIQPSFSFLVGVVLPFSIAGRMMKSQSKLRLTGHAVWRALVLVFLGIFLRSLNKGQTYWTFEDTLTQIGLGYAFLFALAWRPTRDQWIAFVLLVVGIWAAFVIYPAPDDNFPYSSVHVPDKWPTGKTYAETSLWNEDVHVMPGFASHWNKNSNLAWEFDRWLLNKFPREKTFSDHDGGYTTLSFIPTLATMILGLLAGGVLKSERTPGRKVRWLMIAGAICFAIGMTFHWFGVCPIVKRIWTPSWTLFSGGICLSLLAAFYTVIDIWRFRRWAFPLIVIGMNSIAAYCMAEYLLCGGDSKAPGWIAQNLYIHFGHKPFQWFGPQYEPVVIGFAVMFVIWLILYYMYRHKIFIKI
jgi:heparan-alpha-glucosaminide N-acetyltransferase